MLSTASAQIPKPYLNGTQEICVVYTILIFIHNYILKYKYTVEFKVLCSVDFDMKSSGQGTEQKSDYWGGGNV